MVAKINEDVLKVSGALFPAGSAVAYGLTQYFGTQNKSGGNVGGEKPTNRIITPFSDKITQKLSTTNAPKLNPLMATARQMYTDVKYLRGDISDKSYYANTAFNANQVRGGTVGKTPLIYDAQNKQINNLYDSIADKEQTTSDIVVNYVPEKFGGGYVEQGGGGGFDWKIAALIAGGALVLGLLFGGKK